MDYGIIMGCFQTVRQKFSIALPLWFLFRVSIETVVVVNATWGSKSYKGFKAKVHVTSEKLRLFYSSRSPISAS